MNILRKKGPCVIDRGSLWGQLAVTVMICSAIFRLIGSIGLMNDPQYMMWQLALPLGCNLLFVLCIVLLGKKGFFMSFIAVAAGVVFFVLNTLSADNMGWKKAVWVAVWMLVLLIYVCTVFRVFRGRWLLTVVSGAVFLYLVMFVDLPRLKDTLDPPAFSEGMLEMSSLCIILSLFIASLGMSKKPKNIEDIELPKIKTPIVKVPEKSGGQTESPAVSDDADIAPAVAANSPEARPEEPLTGAEIASESAAAEPEADK